MPPKPSPPAKGQNPGKPRAPKKARSRKPREGPAEAPVDVRPAQVLAMPRRRRERLASAPSMPNPAALMMKNAELYVAQLLAPFDHCGHRVPDLLSFPTATTRFRELIEFKTNIAQPIQVSVQPYPLNTNDAYSFFASRDAVGGVFPAVWSRAPSDNVSTFTTNFEYYRVCSMGARLLASSALQNRGGTIIAGRYQNRSDLPTAGAAIARNPAFTTVAATGPGGECFQTYRPSTYEAGLEFNPPIWDNTVPPEPILLWEFSATPDGAQSYTIEVMWHIEFIPKAVNAPLFETASAPGAASDVAAAYMRAEAGAGDIDQQSSPDWTDRLARAASRLADTPVGKAAGAALGRHAAQYLSRTLGAYPGSTPSMELLRVRGNGVALARANRQAAPPPPAPPPAVSDAEGDEIIVVRRATRTM